ncbi:MAG: hypothetical protein FJ015_06210 [Chloroflexi bacterium]|nr:hypothetical protein [Chloroflexota bacterium]
MFQKASVRLAQAREFRLRTIALCAMGAIMLVAVGSPPLLANPGTVTMRVDPATRTAPVNATFAVSIVADVGTEMNPNGLGAYEFDLVYDPNYLEVISVNDAGKLDDTGRTVNALGPNINNPAGRTAFGAYSYYAGTPQPAGPSGTVVLATVTLRAKKVGVTTLNLQNALLTDTQANAWPDGAGRNLNVQGGTVVVAAISADFDGDGKADAALYRDGYWFIKRSSDGGMTVIVHGGLPQDKPFVGDFDGDGKADAGLYRDGYWFIKRSSDGGMTAFPHGGLPQDKPLVGDFDGDGKADAGLYRDGYWFINRSSDGGMTVIMHGGLAQDKPLVGDFDGDGKADAGLYRDGYWFIKRSGDGGMTAFPHGGLTQDKPLVGDFDADGKADAGLYRDGYWFIKRSSDGGMTVIVHGGLAQDIPFVGDFDGDGKVDAGLYRDGYWFIKRSSDGGMTAFPHGGLPQDIALNQGFRTNVWK